MLLLHWPISVLGYLGWFIFEERNIKNGRKKIKPIEKSKIENDKNDKTKKKIYKKKKTKK